MAGIKLMMLGGGVAAEDPGSVTYSAGASGSIYNPTGYSTVDLEIKGVGGRSRPYGEGSGQYYSNSGKGTTITKDDVSPGDVTIYVGNLNAVPGSSPGGTGGTGGATTHPDYDGGVGGAASVADIDGTASVAAGGGGDSGKRITATNTIGQAEGDTAYPGNTNTAPSDVDGGNGTGGGCYYGGGGGGGGGVKGGVGGNKSKGGAAGGNGSSTDGSINYTSRTLGDNQGNGQIVVSWG